MKRAVLAVCLASLGLAACESSVTDTPPVPEVASSLVEAGLSPIVPGDGDLQSFIDRANVALAEQGAGVAIAKAEWLGTGVDTDANKIVFANDRELRLGSRWVPNDPRRGATGLDLTQSTFSPLAFADGANGLIPTEAIIDRTFDTWNGVRCSKLQVNKLPSLGAPPSLILGGPFPVADINTIGWIPGPFFDAVLGPGASASVLGVAFTFTFIDPATGERTDVDGDGRNDTAFKEVWYNNAFTWATDGSPGEIDVESVVLHENGHALELAHFGKLTARFDKNGNLKRIQASPRAVMNASYYEPLRNPLGTDNAAMCGNFANWK